MDPGRELRRRFRLFMMAALQAAEGNHFVTMCSRPKGSPCQGAYEQLHWVAVVVKMRVIQPILLWVLLYVSGFQRGGNQRHAIRESSVRFQTQVHVLYAGYATSQCHTMQHTYILTPRGVRSVFHTLTTFHAFQQGNDSAHQQHGRSEKERTRS